MTAVFNERENLINDQNFTYKENNVSIYSTPPLEDVQNYQDSGHRITKNKKYAMKYSRKAQHFAIKLTS